MLFKFFTIFSLKKNSIPNIVNSECKSCFISLIAFFYFFIHFVFCTAQSTDKKVLIDSLNKIAFEIRYTVPENAFFLSKKAIQHAGSDTMQTSFILSLRNAGISKYVLTEYNTALYYLSRALKISEHLNDSVSLSACYNNLYTIYNATGKIKKAKKYLLRSLEIDIALKDTVGIAFNLNNLASLHILNGETDKGLELYLQSASLALLSNNMLDAADAYNNIATVYIQINNPQKSLFYHKKALDIYVEYQSMPDIAMSLANIAHTMVELNRQKEALQYVDSSISIRKQLNDNKRLAYSYFIKSIVLQSLDSTDSAESLFFYAMNMSLDIGNYHLLAKGFYSQANFYLSRNDTLNAILYFLNSLEFARETENIPMLSEILENISKLYHGRGDFEKAYYFLEKLHKIESEISKKHEPKINLLTYTQPESTIMQLRSKFISLTGILCIIILSVLCVFLHFRLKKLLKQFKT